MKKRKEGGWGWGLALITSRKAKIARLLFRFAWAAKFVMADVACIHVYILYVA